MKERIPLVILVKKDNGKLPAHAAKQLHRATWHTNGSIDMKKKV